MAGDADRGRIDQTGKRPAVAARHAQDRRDDVAHVGGLVDVVAGVEPSVRALVRQREQRRRDDEAGRDPTLEEPAVLGAGAAQAVPEHDQRVRTVGAVGPGALRHGPDALALRRVEDGRDQRAPLMPGGAPVRGGRPAGVDERLRELADGIRVHGGARGQRRRRGRCRRRLGARARRGADDRDGEQDRRDGPPSHPIAHRRNLTSSPGAGLSAPS